MPLESVQVLFDRVLVREDDPDTMIGSLHVPSTAEEKTGTGVVVKLGTGLPCLKGIHPIPLKVNDRILMQYPPGSPITVDGEELMLVHVGRIRGVLESDTP